MNTVEPIRSRTKIEAMRRYLAAGAHGTRDVLMFTLGINGGMRIRDILRLKVGDVVGATGRIRTGLIRYRDHKTGKENKLPFSPKVLKAMEAHLANISTDPQTYLFPSRKGENQPITRFRAWAILNEAARSVGIEDNIGAHSMRKTWGYHSYKGGIDLALIQEVFNHSSQAETLRYIGITADEKAKAIKAVDL